MKWLAAMLLTCPVMMAQDSRPKFEVASVKECQSGERSARSTISPGRLHLSCWNLKRLILQAYEVYGDGKVNPLNPSMPLAPLEGDPSWVSSTAYTVDAKAEEPESGAMMMGPIMQTLLEERFHLKVHRETRDVPAYLMTAERGGAKLQPSKDGSCAHLDPTDFAQPQPARDARICGYPSQQREGSTNHTYIYGVTLDIFAKMLHPNGKPVIDRTGLTGIYDIHMTRTADEPAPASGAASDPAPHASEIQSMREQLGLRLEPGKGPVEFLVIDHIERPSGN
jgi:uncharacterized protein (TIGR03435 family)